MLSTCCLHLHHLEAVFECLKSYGFKLRPDKCVLFQRQVRFLGHPVSRDVVAPDPDKITSVQSWPVPQTIQQVRSFLGFAGYYYRFIAEFASITYWLKQKQPPLLAFADFKLPFRL